MENTRPVSKIAFFNGKRDADQIVRIDQVKGLGVEVEDGEYSCLNPQFHKYDLVKKNLMGEDFTDNYTHVLWGKYNIYIELQKLSAHFVRLLYVEKVIYENYKDFLFKPYERFRRREIKPDWMKDL